MTATESHNKKRRRVGALRPSQLLTTFGVGSVVDLPGISVMVMGLNYWHPQPGDELFEPRLLEAVQRILGPQIQMLYRPPIADERTGTISDAFGREAITGVPVGVFPRWLLCPKCRLLAPLESGLFELKHHPVRIEETFYTHKLCRNGSAPHALPARFLVACEHGHLDDFPWVFFVHRGPTTCNARLKLTEHGTSGDAAEIFLHCEVCNAGRPMVEAFGRPAKLSLPQCRGRWPHLDEFDKEACDQPLRTITTGASNSWFSQIVMLLALPNGENRLKLLIQHYRDELAELNNDRELYFLRRGGGLPELAEYSDDDIWRELQGTTTPILATTQTTSLKAPEWQLLTQPATAPEDRDFRIRAVAVPAPFTGSLERVVLAERLRQVSALVGFTRIIAPDDLNDGATSELSQVAPLGNNLAWVPVSEVRGEGIFLQFREEAIQAWLNDTPALTELDAQFHQAQREWCLQLKRNPAQNPFPGMRFVLLHTFAHAFMRQVVLACGYSAASLSERIYAAGPDAPDGPMAGILIYTAAPDSEGTLGGLVRLGQPQELQRHLAGALERLVWCASDPLCAEHRPQGEALAVHAAACHTCLFVPETSCERGNKYLDRSVLVRTVEQDALAFF